MEAELRPVFEPRKFNGPRDRCGPQELGRPAATRLPYVVDPKGVSAFLGVRVQDATRHFRPGRPLAVLAKTGKSRFQVVAGWSVQRT